jgi:mRNA interferase HigB
MRKDTASKVKDENNIVIFNIKGNKYRLVTKISYLYKTVLIKWIGTHAEYDKKDFKGGKS